MPRTILLLFLACLPACLLLAASEEEYVLGELEFETSASGQAQEKFILGVKALHSFWYEQAREFFIEAQQLDPAFGMAWWGEAMSFDNALGTMMDPDYEGRGIAVVARMLQMDVTGQLRWNDKERLWFEALKIRFDPELSLTERRRNYGRAMEEIVERYPQADEAQAFSALALMSFPGFNRELADHVVLAAAPLEALYERNPDHPGALHYLIHVYDTPTFASMGLRQARRYGQVAASAPHAVHMPSHIYKHLGMGDEMLLANVTSWLVSVEWQQDTGRPIRMRDFHTFSWLLDTYLLLGQEDRAGQLMRDLDMMEQQIVDRGEAPGHFTATAARLRQTYIDTTGNALP